MDPDLCHSLMSGVVSDAACWLPLDPAEYLRKVSSQFEDDRQVVQERRFVVWVGRHRVAPTSFQARDNMHAFANACVELGMRRSDVCNYSNFEKGDLKQITATLCAFAKLGIPKGLHKVPEDLQVYVENGASWEWE